MNAEGRAPRATAYRRLVSARRLGAALARERQPARVRAALERIVSDGRATLREVGRVADPYLLSHTRLALAAAHFDLAALEEREARRAKRVAIATGHLLAGVRTALASGTTFLSLGILPWAMVVITGGLRVARGSERRRLGRMLVSCARALPKVQARQVRDRRSGARTLFRSQLLLVAGESARDGRARATIMRRAREVAGDALRRSLGAGDGPGARQARATRARIEARL